MALTGQFPFADFLLLFFITTRLEIIGTEDPRA